MVEMPKLEIDFTCCLKELLQKHADTIILLKAWTYAVTFGGQIPSGLYAAPGWLQSMLACSASLHVEAARLACAQPQIKSTIHLPQLLCLPSQ